MAAQLLMLTALIGPTAHARMQAQTLGVGARWLSERRRAPWCGLQAQHFAPCARPQDDAVGAGGRLQRGEHAVRVDEAAVSHVGNAFLFDQMTEARR